MKSTNNQPTPPLLNAVHHFALHHRLPNCLSDASVVKALSSVSSPDFTGMYKAASHLLPYVPVSLHCELYEKLSDALVAPIPSGGKHTMNDVLHLYEQLEKALNTTTTTTSHSPCPSSSVQSLSSLPSSPSLTYTPITTATTMTTTTTTTTTTAIQNTVHHGTGSTKPVVKLSNGPTISVIPTLSKKRHFKSSSSSSSSSPSSSFSSSPSTVAPKKKSPSHSSSFLPISLSDEQHNIKNKSHDSLVLSNRTSSRHSSTKSKLQTPWSNLKPGCTGFVPPPIPTPSPQPSPSSSSLSLINASMVTPITNSTATTSYLDECGTFPIFNRHPKHSFFTFYDNKTNQLEIPNPNSHTKALVNAGHLSRADLVSVYINTTLIRPKSISTKLESITLQQAVKHHFDDNNDNDNDNDNDNEDLMKLKKVVEKWTEEDWTNVARTAEIQGGWSIAKMKYLKCDAPWLIGNSNTQQQQKQQQWTENEDKILKDKKFIEESLSGKESKGWVGIAEQFPLKLKSLSMKSSSLSTTPLSSICSSTSSSISSSSSSEDDCSSSFSSSHSTKSKKPLIKKQQQQQCNQKQNRTALELLRRWRFLHDESIRKCTRRRWTESENTRLRILFEHYKLSSWEKVAIALGTLRSAQQCLHRYRKRLANGIKNGRWQNDEIKRLQCAVKTLGEKHWNEISRIVGTRTDIQCREKYMLTSRAQSSQRGEWTPHEDRELRKVVACFMSSSSSLSLSSLSCNNNSNSNNINNHNNNNNINHNTLHIHSNDEISSKDWRKISSQMDGCKRDALQCQRRFHVMWKTEEEIKLLNALKQIWKNKNNKNKDKDNDNDNDNGCQVGDFIDWEHIAKQVGTKSVRQCRRQASILYKDYCYGLLDENDEEDDDNEENDGNNSLDIEMSENED